MAGDVFTIENGATLREVIQRLKGVPSSCDKPGKRDWES